MVSIKGLAEQASAYGIPSAVVDRNDIISVHSHVMKAVERAGNGYGPTFLECKTYRYLGHHLGDVLQPYKTKLEVEEWKKRDPID